MGTPKAVARSVMGRPRILDRHVTPPGSTEPMPLIDALVQMLRDGTNLDRACKAVGVSADNVYTIIGDGVNIRAALDEGRCTEADLTPLEAATFHFSRVIGAARHEALAEREALMGQLARGGIVKTKRKSVTDPQGNVSLVVEQEVLPPSEGMLRWFAERKYPQEYGPTQRVEHALVGGEATVQTSPLDRLTSALDEIERRKEAGAGVIPVQEVEAG